MQVLIRRSWRVAIIGTCAAVSALGAAAWQGLDRAEGQETGYRFSNVLVSYATNPQDGQVDTGHATISYESAWAADTYPGVLECTWTIYDAEGNVLGQQSGTFSSRSNPGGTLHHEITIDRGVPARGTIGCNPARLDNPAGHYRFSGLRISPADTPGGGQDARPRFRITMDMAWQGDGRPSAQECVATVYSRSGEELFTHSFGLSSVDAVADDLDTFLYVAEAPPTAPASVDLSCIPFGS